MIEKIIENFPEGTTRTAGKLLATSMGAGEKIGERLSDCIDSLVDKFIN